MWQPGVGEVCYEEMRFSTLFSWYRDRKFYERKGIVRGGSDAKEGHSLVVGLRGVRYQVKDVKRSIDFYTKQLGFKLDQQNLPAFGQVSAGNFKLILSGPGASGSRPMPDGRQQEPGGWNRIVLQVSDLPARIEIGRAHV